MGNSSRTFLLSAFLIVIICSVILPVFSLQYSMSISSHGTVDYSQQPSPSKNGEIYMIIGFWLTDDGGYTPNKNAIRIVNAKNAYGRPEWVEVGNWGGEGGARNPHLRSNLINFFHNVGIKVACRVWSNYGEKPMAQIKGDIDFQMSIGPEIDAFMIDETNQWPSNPNYYIELRDYVHSKGKLIFNNVGGWGIREETCAFGDMINVEHEWRQFIANKQDLIAKYPKKFGGWEHGQEGWEPPANVPDAATAVAQTLQAWNGGIYYFDTRVTTGALPSWWEDYLSQLSG